jgi:pimeloyl-ACP methyl ester carboxylesterase
VLLAYLAASRACAIGCLTLVACGRQDAFTPLSQHEAMAGAIKDAVLEVFEDAGHFAPVGTPSAVSAALRRWPERPSGSTRRGG